MRKLLVATGVAVATATTMANAVEVGGVKITPNVEVGWQKGKIDADASGVGSNGDTFTETGSSNAKSEFVIGQVGLEAQYKNYFGGIRYTHDKLKGTMDTIMIYNSGGSSITIPDSFDYSVVLERYLAYVGYQFNLNNVELKPYASIGYFNSNLDKGNFVGLGLTGKLHLPYGVGVFASVEYDKTFGGKSKYEYAVDKDIKDIWEVSAGVSKKINFAETYIKAYYREHKINNTHVGNLGTPITYTWDTNYKFKITGIMVGMNF